MTPRRSLAFSLARRPARRRALAARAAVAGAAVAALLATFAAQAQLRQEGGGSYDVAPMYRGLAYGYIFDGNSNIDDRGLDYVSNIAPRTLASEFGQLALGDASAYLNGWAAYSGFYASRNYASMTVHNPQADQTYYMVAGQGSTTSITFFDANAAAERAVFNWHVSGSSSSTVAGGTADGRLDFFATTEQGRSWLDLFDGSFEGSLSVFGPGDYSFTLPVAALGTPIYLHYWSSAYVLAVPGEVTPGQSFNLTADYGNTVVLTSIDLYDANDNLLSDWTMVETDTGAPLFNDFGRLTPVMPPPPVPEPGSWALMLGGLGWIGWLRGRRKRS